MAAGTLTHHSALELGQYYLTDPTAGTPSGFDMVLAGPFRNIDEVRQAKAKLGLTQPLKAVCEIPPGRD